MTLIVCLKAKDCIVIAADSLTSLGRKIVSCTTEKLHNVATDAVTAGCGLSRVQGTGWQAILAGFPAPSPGTAFATTVLQLQAFLEGIIGQVPKGNVGACQGGNTFLLAGHDVVNSDMAVARLTRLWDRRQFEPATMDSHASSHNYIEWIGDTTAVTAYIASKTALYVPDMPPKDAVDFAVGAITGGITASLAAGNHTIGGEFVSVALVSAGSVAFSRYPTGIPCTVAALIGSSPAAPDAPAPLAD
ncbi:hypothetical protein [Azospirillum aestuarii]|uniref:hypothetical protein n=1 Tax=Azospirillum aestuarii TaxID=2802052 RepID=UPI004054CF0B